MSPQSQTAAPTTLDEWLDYIAAQHPASISLGLERVREVWQCMAGEGQPPQAPINITVGGTNGKGSTCAMLEAILHCAGYKVGCYTSPHLLTYNERVRIGLLPVSDAVLCESFAAVEAARGATALTYFEFGTLCALRIFARAGVDVAVLEVGLGGRLDAVNLVDADCAMVVCVDLDHQEYLGATREAIGFEKAGIYRAGKPALYGENDPPHSLLAHVANIRTDLLVFGRDFGFQNMEQQWNFHGPRGKHLALPLPALRGPYQLRNAAGALALLDELHDVLPVGMGHIRRGLLEVELPGRLQVLPGRPAIVLDVAHNPHAARMLEDALGTMGYFEKTFAVFGMLRDKDVAAVVNTLKERIDRWYLATLHDVRGSSAAELEALLLQAGVPAGKLRTFTGVAGAVAAARSDAGQSDRILIFGSFHTVADALISLKRTGPH